MGSFHYRDFVTDLPIVENYGLDLSNGEDEEELKAVFICAPDRIPGGEQALASITYPMFGYYDDYGRFKLANSNPDSMFSKANKFAEDLADKGIVVDGCVEANRLEDEGKFINATSYNLYKSAVESIAGNPVSQGIFTLDETHKEAFDKRVIEFKKYMEGDSYRNIILDIPFIFKKHKEILMNPFSEHHEKVYEAIKDEDLYNYLLDWDIFQDFLTYNYKAFKKPYQLGRQDVMLKSMRVLKELEMAELEKLEDKLSYQLEDEEY